MKELILTMLLSFPPYYKDVETWAVREERMDTIATSIDYASSRATCSNEFKTKNVRRFGHYQKNH